MKLLLYIWLPILACLLVQGHNSHPAEYKYISDFVAHQSDDDTIFTALFSIDDEPIHLKLAQVQNIFAPDAHLHSKLLSNSDISSVSLYREIYDDGSFATASISKNGESHLTFFHNDALYHMEPALYHEHSLDPFEMPHDSVKDLMVAYDVSDPGDHTAVIFQCDGETDDSYSSPESNDRRVSLQDTTLPDANCYSGDSEIRTITIGVAVTKAYLELYGSDQTKVLEKVASMLVPVNALYESTFHIKFAIGTVIMHDATTNEVPFSHSTMSDTCPTVCEAKMELISYLRAENVTNNGVWYLFSFCPTVQSKVGCSNDKELCNRGYQNVAAAYSIGSRDWIVLAHELGHLVGASHQDIGIMRNRLDSMQKIGNKYLFHPDNYDEVCDYLRTKVADETCMISALPVCGDSAVDPGEACDDGPNGSECCTPLCTFRVDRECSDLNSPECCLNCQFLGSLTRCGSLDPDHGMQGYCRNGVCEPSECDVYCGQSASNPCLQKCVNGDGDCVDDLSNPTMPENTVCSEPSQPLKTCKQGVCVSETLTYHWQDNVPWSDCVVNTVDGCGPGTQTRIVPCKDELGRIVPNNLCPLPSPATSQACVVTNCYVYTNTEWSECSTECGTGVQFRTVDCYNVKRPEVWLDYSYCVQPPPAFQRTCNTQACAYSWVYSEWSECSTLFGLDLGTRERTALCFGSKDGISFLAPNGTFCGPTAPLKEQCSGVPAQYHWVEGPWGSCSKDCGTGTQKRVIKCYDPDGKISTSCPNPPEVTRSCNTHACPTYVWKCFLSGAEVPCISTNFYPCTDFCGTGQRRRDVKCVIELTNKFVDDSLCNELPPISFAPCNTRVCPYFTWDADVFGECSEECDPGGTMTRTVTCENVAVDPPVIDPTFEECKKWKYPESTNPPPTTRDCNKQGCLEYAWKVSDWGPCESCKCEYDAPLRVREVECVVANSSFPANRTSQCGSMLVVEEKCDPCLQYQWQIEEELECSEPCGGGIKTFNVYCWDSTTQEKVDDLLCDHAIKPPETAPCNLFPCDAAWITGPWTPCSASCGWGIQSRQIQCILLIPNKPISFTYCKLPYPGDVQDCNIFDCPRWDAGAWSNCSEPCDDGIRSRDVVCLDHKDNMVDGAKCKAHSRPQALELCREQTCPVWVVGDEWSDCSQLCGGGEQTRDVICQWRDGPNNPNPENTGDVIDEELFMCPINRPAESQPCNIFPCTDYFYKITQYTQCSAPCGPGSQQASAWQCFLGSKTVSNSLCDQVQADKPLGNRSCQIQPCPSVEYEWRVIHDWGKCDAICDGTTKRVVGCYDKVKNVKVCNNNCKEPKPITKQPCNDDVGICNNGTCTRHVCACDEPFKGEYCKKTGTCDWIKICQCRHQKYIIPGNNYVIRWTCSDVRNVSLGLIEIETGGLTAIDYNVVNHPSRHRSSAYIWRVPKTASAGEHKLVVMYSNLMSAYSQPFTIRNTCESIGCNGRGKCDKKTHKCKCNYGWSGPRCTISPCKKKGCNLAHSTCYARKHGHAKCYCKDGWHGERCFRPPNDKIDCSNYCLNGGTLRCRRPKLSCGWCNCPGQWEGKRCERCSLHCGRHGKPNSDCTKCICDRGRGGPYCHCKYVKHEVVHTLRASAFIRRLARPRYYKELVRTIRRDLAWAAHVDWRRISDFEVKVHYGRSYRGRRHKHSVFVTVSYHVWSECFTSQSVRMQALDPSVEYVSPGGKSMTELSDYIKNMHADQHSDYHRGLASLEAPADASIPMWVTVVAPVVAGITAGTVAAIMLASAAGVTSTVGVVATAYLIKKKIEEDKKRKASENEHKLEDEIEQALESEPQPQMGPRSPTAAYEKHGIPEPDMKRVKKTPSRPKELLTAGSITGRNPRTALQQKWDSVKKRLSLQKQ